MDFDPVERYYHMSAQEIRRIQEEKLRDFMRYQVYPFSPYYRKLFDDNGIDPDSIRRIEDLERIPLTRKEDIMPTEQNPKRYKDFILQPDLEKIKRYWPRTRLLKMKMKQMAGRDVKEELNREYYPNFMIATSGTTGNNVPFMYTLRDIKQFSNAFRSVQDVVGLKNDHVVLNAFPFAPHLAFVFVYWVNVHSPLRIFHTGGGAVTSTVKTLEVIEAVDANCMLGIPSYIYHLLRNAQEKKSDLSGIELVLTAGEKLTGSTRENLREMLIERGAKDPKIFNIYGTTEMRDAIPECKPGVSEFHIHPNLHIFEIVDPETGKQKKEGESGAVAVTSIDGRGTVVLRFLIGDIFEGGIRYDRCPHCGSSIPRIVGPIGRIRDYSRKVDLTNIKGTLLNLNLFYDVMPKIEGVDEWQVSIEKKNNDPHELDLLKINVAALEGYDRDKLRKEIVERINDAVEINPVVDTSFEADRLFERMGGKVKVQRIVDLRDEIRDREE